ncbi:hypothetical protein GGR56DRAFT_614667 [Xylariaceae sp. FL0804]|nr:hypothetical protein GGR56DRAFT_614667 [Xylariaceae sp. FL0804]
MSRPAAAPPLTHSTERSRRSKLARTESLPMSPPRAGLGSGGLFSDEDEDDNDNDDDDDLDLDLDLPPPNRLFLAATSSSSSSSAQTNRFSSGRPPSPPPLATAHRWTSLYVAQPGAGLFREVRVRADQADALRARYERDDDDDAGPRRGGGGEGGGRSRRAACWRRSDVVCVDLTGED